MGDFANDFRNEDMFDDSDIPDNCLNCGSQLIDGDYTNCGFDATESDIY